ncbi:MAG TPA: hypothetical protein PLL69_11490 [Gemmatimonadales bacterium]|nr:hypothetical protein [Gemmatimonadales bacterium]
MLGDSIRPVEAIHDQASRQQRAGSNPSVFRSTARTLSENCARAARTVDPVIEFAAGLSTSDQRFGDRAVNRWRTALDQLKDEMGRCSTAASEQGAGAGDPAPSQVTAISTSARKSVADYRKAEFELLNTLKIQIDPRDRI